LLVVTGKSFGKTNMILLDSNKNVIQRNSVTVIPDTVKVVNLHRGTARESYNCSPTCKPTITVGDHSAYFAAAADNAKTKIKMSAGIESNEQASQ